MTKKKDLTKEDKEVWENFTKQPSNIYDKEQDNKKYNSRKEQFNYDLHGFTLEDANRKVKEIILSAVDNKYKEILLITGKGLHSTTDDDAYVSKELSKLKFSVPEYINSEPEISKLILSVVNPSQKDGGDGALLIKLKKL